jgi:LacI family transcriptional regulator
MDNNKPRHIIEGNIIEQEIKEGKFGLPGERFLTTRELAQVRGVSLVTAQQILVNLRQKGIIELIGKKYYLTHGRIQEKTPYKKQKKCESRLIGLHITNLESEFFASLAKAAEICARAEGYRVLIASSSYGYEEEMDILNTFREIGVAGVLSCPGTSEKAETLYENYVLPHVFLGRKPKSANAEGVLVNCFPTTCNIAAHFISKGFKNFAYVGLNQLRRGEDIRLTGFKEGLLREGYVLEEENIILVDAKNIPEDFKSVHRFLRNIKQPTAIFCFHDLLAVRVLKLCHELKIAVPERVAIAGFDNLPITLNTSPSLTTVSYRTDEMAQTAVRLLIDQIKTGKESNTNYYIEPSLIIRGSTSNVKNKKQETIEMHNVFA